jgi:TfoX/Sxy family transcriptional regulator of competence genes
MTHLQPDAQAEQRFEQLAVQFLANPTVTQGTGFGSSPGLRTTGKIFAMLINSELVVKLPKARVDQLLASGTGGRFDPGHGRLMKEWATVALDGTESWERLAAEALQFVGSAVKSPQ